MLKKIVLCSSLVVLLLAQPSEAAEVCGNGVDDDSDGLADEGCTAVVCESPLSCGDTGMVSPATGALSYKLPPDIAPAVPWGPGVGFRRTYQSQYAPGGAAPAYRKALGERWTHTYATWLDRNGSATPPNVVLHMSQGRDTLIKLTTTIGGWDTFQTFQPGFHAQYLRQRQTSPNEWELKLLTGETIVYNSSGKLTEIWDTLATPNKVLVAYDGSGMVSTVTDAKGTRRLLFAYTGTLMTSVTFQINSGSWTTQHTTTYAYTSSNLTSVTIGGQLAQTNVYISNYLTQIQDGASNTIVGFAYDGTTAGKLDRVDTSRGTVGFEYNSARASCSGKTVAFFNKGNTTSCSIDGDCGTGFLCGGKTGAGSTGVCFRAARCLTISSPSEDVVTTVTAMGPPDQTCTGACTEVGEYIWNTGVSTLDEKATKDPAGNFTSRVFNANGLVETINYGDLDSDPTNTNAARVEFLTYSSAFPGKIATRRRKTDLDDRGGCISASSTTDCTITAYSYNADGLVSSVAISGNTIDVSGVVSLTTATNTYTYNTRGQLTQVDGPLSGADDVTVKEYWSSADPLKEGFVQNVKRKKDATNYLTTSTLAYDFRGNATGLLAPDGTVSCQTFDATRGYLSQRREAMNGQTDCTTTNAADLVTSWTRDSYLRVTQLTRPDGSCLFYEHDTMGRLIKTKRRDDCNAASSGDRQEFTYDNDGLLTKIESFDAASTVTFRREMTYLDGRQLEHIINPVATSTFVNFVYDARGFVIEVHGESSLSKTTYTINGDNRTTAVIRNKTSSTSDTWSLGYTWSGAQSSVQDGDSKVTQSVRDDFGRVVRISNPDLTGGPSLRVYDPAGRMTNLVDAFGGVGARTHTYTYDHLGRSLTEDDPQATCTNAEVQRSYDTLPGSAPCPVGMSCDRTNGRIAYIKTSLRCSSVPTDKSIDQETWFSYDAAGRVVREYIKDDNGRTADQQYAWTKNGALASVTMPSGAVHGWSYGSAGSNSDTDLVSGTWRTTTATPVTNTVLWSPYGPLARYNQQNLSTLALRTRINYDLAHRVTSNRVERQDTVTTQQLVSSTRDAKGRVTLRDYTGVTGQNDSYFLYDQQDRVLCETTTLVASCPISGAGIKNSHSLSVPFTNAGDWTRILRPIPGSTGLINDFNPSGYGSSHQVTMVRQNFGTPALGDTGYVYDGYGNRSYDDNAALLQDRRDYTYDSNNNLTNVRGRFRPAGGVVKAFHYYQVMNFFDSRNRRVLKSFYDETTLKTAQWFMYYDPMDHLTEVRYTPDTSVPATYSVFELFWIGDRLTLYWQTDYPSATTSKRYVGTDETNRPIDMMTWPASGDTTRVWAVNESAWGIDTNLVGPSVFQPVLFAGQYNDPETTSWLDDGVTRHRPGLVYNWHRTYDPFVGGYLQVDPLVPETWSSYGYVDSDPVGKTDPSGLMMSLCRNPLTQEEINHLISIGAWGEGYESIDVCGTNPGTPTPPGGGPSPPGGGHGTGGDPHMPGGGRGEGGSGGGHGGPSFPPSPPGGQPPSNPFNIFDNDHDIIVEEPESTIPTTDVFGGLCNRATMEIALFSCAAQCSTAELGQDAACALTPQENECIGRNEGSYDPSSKYCLKHCLGQKAFGCFNPLP